jgi:hypothetical protein
MFKEKIAIAIKSKINKPLPELNNKFQIPNNSTFSIYLKNMNEETAYINVYVNNKKVTSTRIELKTKESIDIHKYQDSMHSFKFIVKDLDLQMNRENQPEDGLIRIEVDFEKKELSLTDKMKKIIDNPYYKPYDINRDIGRDKNVFTNPYKESIYFSEDDTIKSGGFKDINCDMQNMVFKSNTELDKYEDFGIENKVNTNKPGLIVPGKISNKEDEFTTTGKKYEVSRSVTIILELEENDLNLDGEIFGKKKCPSCKKKFKKNYLYCPYDGTFLDK